MSQGPNDPLEPLLDQLASLLKFAEQNASKSLAGDVDPEIKNQIAKLKGDVDKFCESCDQALGQQGESIIKTYATLIESPETLTTREKKLIRQYGDLGTNALIL